MKIKKTICIILLVCLTLLLSSCNNSAYNKVQYHSQKGINLDYRYFYEIRNLSELNKMRKYTYAERLEEYDNKYFEKKGLVVFLIGYPTSPNEFEIKSKSLDGGILEMDVVTLKKGINLSSETWIVFYEINLKKLDKLSTIKITHDTEIKEYAQRELKAYKGE